MPQFYATTPSNALRFGDVIVGFRNATPQIKAIMEAASESTWTISVSQPAHYAIMTPCCSIEREALLVAPLISIRSGFLNNPYFESNLLRINKKVPAQQSLPPQAWEGMPADEKARRLAVGEQYVFQDCFVYGEHQLFPRYIVPFNKGKESREVGHYMVDFKSIFRVESALIDRTKNAPSGMKRLELSIPTRALLRDKIALFFGNVPEEDRIYAA